MSTVSKINDNADARDRGGWIPLFVAAICILCAAYIALAYSHQAPLDLFSFRQTQTALTSYWLAKDGFKLAYETPIGGPPWSIPFEFPIYQYIVALVWRFTDYSLDAIGRIVSFTFLLLCLVPIRSIVRQLGLPSRIFVVFCVLLMSSPEYLYWGRAFLIETSALFFTIAAIKYFVDIAQQRITVKNVLLYLFFILLGLLQKVTTALPVLAIIALIYLVLSIRRAGSIKEVLFGRPAMLALLLFGFPLAVATGWVIYTDKIKMLNEMGQRLTSSAISGFNWGTLKQRFSSFLYTDVIWRRIFDRNLAGALGLVVLCYPFVSDSSRTVKWTTAIALGMGLLPIFLFTNLHIIHDYYQTANVIFFIFALAVSFEYFSRTLRHRTVITVIFLIVMLGANYSAFSRDYLGAIVTKYTASNSRDYAVSDALKTNVLPDQYFIAFGNDWSSSFAYLSQRKSFTVPNFFRRYDEIAKHPDRFIDRKHLGAVALCPSTLPPSPDDFFDWMDSQPEWKSEAVQGCYIAAPERMPVSAIPEVPTTECEGNLEAAVTTRIGKRTVIDVAGWTTYSVKEGKLPDNVYITLAANGAPKSFHEAMRVNRPDVNTFFKRPNDSDSGFSRLLDVTGMNGEITIGLARSYRGKLESCQFSKRLVLAKKTVNE